MLCVMVDWGGDWMPLGNRPVGTEINLSFGAKAILYP